MSAGLSPEASEGADAGTDPGPSEVSPVGWNAAGTGELADDAFQAWDEAALPYGEGVGGQSPAREGRETLVDDAAPHDLAGGAANDDFDWTGAGEADAGPAKPMADPSLGGSKGEDSADEANADVAAFVMPAFGSAAARPVPAEWGDPEASSARRLHFGQAAAVESAEGASQGTTEAANERRGPRIIRPGDPSEPEAENEDNLFDDQVEAVLDTEALRDIVAEIIRQELQGTLGEKITRSVRKLVRREIHRALESRDLE